MAFFDSRHLLIVHLVELLVVAIVIGLSVPRLFMKDQPRTRSNTIALGMGAKSIVIILYQLLTQHVAKFYRWASLKANTILNSLEIVFWAAVVFLMIQGNIQACAAIGCILSWIAVGFAIVMTILATYAAFVSYRAFRLSRRTPSSEKAQINSV